LYDFISPSMRGSLRAYLCACTLVVGGMRGLSRVAGVSVTGYTADEMCGGAVAGSWVVGDGECQPTLGGQGAFEVVCASSAPGSAWTWTDYTASDCSGQGVTATGNGFNCYSGGMFAPLASIRVDCSMSSGAAGLSHTAVIAYLVCAIVLGALLAVLIPLACRRTRCAIVLRGNWERRVAPQASAAPGGDSQRPPEPNTAALPAAETARPSAVLPPPPSGEPPI
jgi:hypothetical protein